MDRLDEDDLTRAVVTLAAQYGRYGYSTNHGVAAELGLAGGEGSGAANLAAGRFEPAFPIWIISFVGPNAVFSCKIKVLASPCHHLARGPNG